MSTDMQGYIDSLIAGAGSKLGSSETLLAYFQGEESDFVRFNGGAVRQAGSVKQLSVEIDLVAGKQHTTGSAQLSGVPEDDRHRMADLVSSLRQQREAVPEDPYLQFNTAVESTNHTNVASLPEAADAIDEVREATAGRDMVGIYAGGRQFSGFANSLGQRNWYDSQSFNMDWSLYLDADKATKEMYAGFNWDHGAFERKVAHQVAQLDVLGRSPVTLPPGQYRAYLTPAALHEIAGMLSWGGFSLKSHKTTDSPLLRMVSDGVTLDPSVHIAEDTANGVSPNFQNQGFIRPDTVTLIDAGQFSHHLVSPRSSAEYGVPNNGADTWESPRSLAMKPGDVPTAKVLDHLDTGIYVANLWYLNFSDRPACRTTGMTRFATFWVENGEIVAPVSVLRFDETVFRMLGSQLDGLTSEAEVLLDPLSYGARSTESATLPGAFVNDMTFTL
jgi:predicted Zn-dependent protease